MRILNGVLAALLLLFVAVQVNDPDAGLWMVLYGAAAVWTGLAALAPRLLAGRASRALLVLSFAGAVAGVLYYWPDTPGWWRTEVWWETETAREGMGMMIIALALLAPLATAFRRGPAEGVPRGRRA